MNKVTSIQKHKLNKEFFNCDKCGVLTYLAACFYKPSTDQNLCPYCAGLTEKEIKELYP